MTATVAPSPSRPPGPESPFAALGFIRRPGPFFRETARRYGDVFWMRLPFFGDNVVVHTPEHLRVFFMSDHTHLEWGDNGFLAPILGGRHEPLGDALEGSSIQVPSGAAKIPGLAEALSATPSTRSDRTD